MVIVVVDAEVEVTVVDIVVDVVVDVVVGAITANAACIAANKIGPLPCLVFSEQNACSVRLVIIVNFLYPPQKHLL